MLGVIMMKRVLFGLLVSTSIASYTFAGNESENGGKIIVKSASYLKTVREIEAEVKQEMPQASAQGSKFKSLREKFETSPENKPKVVTNHSSSSVPPKSEQKVFHSPLNSAVNKSNDAKKEMSQPSAQGSKIQSFKERFEKKTVKFEKKTVEIVEEMISRTKNELEVAEES